ncbi:MAG: helix-hairpin-helix domain-containing protein [Acetobacteraceae bacterium]|nr:helix-hairpin-helix domain-containing protein [Acetobacteraceae bacterium]MBV8523807.1 helix-hairpin-helix domain-containing protein [Acetobacteraceae bacterium]
MRAKGMLATIMLIGLGIASAQAQTVAPYTSGRSPMATPPAASPPAAAHPGAMTPTAPASPQPARPATATVNLNTATAQEIDALPGIGKARTKAIVDERAKGRFKDWADFEKRMSHTSVNAGVRNKIKDQVTF